MSADLRPLSVSLLHVSGSRRGNEEKHELGRITMGRGRGNECSFDAERERSVSHRHCEVRLEEGVPVLYDIGSLNGTYLNGRRVRRAPLSDGDEIGLGREGPCLRFMLHSGKTPGIIVPGAISVEDPAAPIGRTSTEARPSGLEAQVKLDQTLRRYRQLVRSLAVAFGVALLAGGFLVWKLSGKANSNVAIPEAPSKSTESAPPPVPTRASGPGWSLVLTHRDAAGKEIQNREVGAGVVIAPRRFLTTKRALERGEQDLAVGSAVDGGSLTIAVMGPEGPIGVEQVIEHDSELDLVILELGKDADRMPGPASFAVSAGRELVARQPGLADRPVTVIAQLRRDGSPAPSLEAASLLRIQGGPALPGTPLYAGTELAGISLGDDSPGLALTNGSIAAFVQATTATRGRALRRGS
jgi:hypothetical protein